MKKNIIGKWATTDNYKLEKTKDEQLAEKAINLSAQNAMNTPAFKLIPKKERKGVQDAYTEYHTLFDNAYSAFYTQNKFMGYGFLSYLSQDAIMQRGVKTLSDEMTRAWGELISKKRDDPQTDIDEREDGNNSIKIITEQLQKLNVKDVFREASTLTGFFGGCLIYIDVRYNVNTPLTLEELAQPLFKRGMGDFNKAKLSNLKLVGLKPIEPINIAPGTYNSTDPTAQDFFNPQYYYIYGKKIHRSRFLYFADNTPPQILKPIYLFFGIPLAQIAFPYVQDFYKCKETCMKILHKFSCTSLATDIEALISTQGTQAVKDRVNTIAKYRDNDSVIVLDKASEQLDQINTPITGLREMWYSSLELIPMIFGVPSTKMLEISPSGLNSTGEFEMRNFYDAVHTKQNNVFNEPIKQLIDIIAGINGIESDGLSWEWNSLYKLNEIELANVNLVKAQTDKMYYDSGVIGNIEIADRLNSDKTSGYNDLPIPDIKKTDDFSEPIQADKTINEKEI